MPPLSHTLFAAGLLALSTGAFAQPPGPAMGAPTAHGPTRMQAPAKRTDLQKMLEARFAQLDANKDGKLSAEDRGARRAERRDAAFTRLDTDKNGMISKAEFAAAPPRGHPDGMMHRAAMSGRGDMPPPGGMRRGPMGAGPSPEGQPDRTITKAEFVAQGLARFDKIDTDHDGTLSQAERDAARPKMRGHGSDGHGGPGRRGPGGPPPPPPAAPKAQ